MMFNWLVNAFYLYTINLLKKKDLTVVTQMLVDPTWHLSLVYPETLGVPLEGFPNAP